MIKKTNLDWVKHRNQAGYEWNPVQSGLWVWSAYNEQFPVHPSVIIVPSDLAAWEDDWTIRLLKKIELLRKHVFLLQSSDILVFDTIEFPANCWLGLTVNTDQAMIRNEFLYNSHEMMILNPFFMVLSLQAMITGYFFRLADFIVLDGGTGTKPEWVQRIVDFSNKYDRLYYVCQAVYKKSRGKKNRLPNFFSIERE